jgi:hypothetical protein
MLAFLAGKNSFGIGYFFLQLCAGQDEQAAQLEFFDRDRRHR